MKSRLKQALLGLTAVMLLGLGTAVNAKTPANTFVMAKDIADIITMDPAEVFELTTGEIIANIYDRIMMYEPEDLTKLVGGVAERQNDEKRHSPRLPHHQGHHDRRNHL